MKNYTEDETFSRIRRERIVATVVIDDIDRLRGDEIRDIFQLVKLVGDIPNIIYFLSFDQSIVSKVMTHKRKSPAETKGY